MRNRLWIATADIKDMYVPPAHAMRATEARCIWWEMMPFFETLDGTVKHEI